MSKKVCAILLDTRSIQKYIFASNKLKTNVGASYLVGQIFEKYMVEVLRNSNWHMPDADWKEYEGIAMEQDDSVQLEIAYIGGGNILILLNDSIPNVEQVAKDLVYVWTKKLLVVAPGLRTGAAIGQVELGDKFDMNGLYAQLKTNQNTVFPNVDLPYTGLTVECQLSGLPANDRIDGHYVAASEKAKEKIFGEANDKLRYSLRNQVDLDELGFTDSIESLGQKTGDEYIAVIHIDGNNMGVRFQNCQGLAQRKALSLRVAECTKAAFAGLLQSVVADYPLYFDGTFAEGGLLDAKVKRKKFLPVRPIIIGGDDITFVCPAKCGLIYAKRFMELLEQQAVTGGKFCSCAGIAIVPTKYPFFRAYELAEEICSEAKKQARSTLEEEKQGSSWLDFMILHGEQSGDLQRLRKEELTGEQGDMHYGPYRIAPMETTQSVERLICGALAMHNLPRNKVKGLRDVIGKGPGEIQLFMQHLDYSGVHLPNVEGKHERFAKNSWDGGKTPYLDMIEIMDFIFDEGKVQK